jgi:hypothetical protein
MNKVSMNKIDCGFPFDGMMGMCVSYTIILTSRDRIDYQHIRGNVI